MRPAGPSGPAIPCGPGLPCGPGAPGFPCGPCLPAGPALPCAPSFPVLPATPCGPRGPCGPGRPGWPCGPGLPGSPRPIGRRADVFIREVFFALDALAIDPPLPMRGQFIRRIVTERIQELWSAGISAGSALSPPRGERARPLFRSPSCRHDLVGGAAGQFGHVVELEGEACRRPRSPSGPRRSGRRFPIPASLLSHCPSRTSLRACRSRGSARAVPTGWR